MRSKELILVTGAAGFIGGHLVDTLLKSGYRVRGLDNLAPPVHAGRLPAWFNKRAQFMRGDVREKEDWVRALRGVSTVFHLAAYMDFHPDFSTYLASNVTSIASLFEVIKKKGYPIKKIIAASSQSVYGEGKYRCSRHGVLYPETRSEAQLSSRDWQVHCPHDRSVMKPMREKEDDFFQPHNMYGISKKQMEEVLFYLGKRSHIPVVALRYSIVHGPRQTVRHFYSGALRQLAMMALSGMPLTMHEDGRQTRDFVHIEDVMQAHLTVFRDNRADYEAFNVGSGRAYTVRELSRTIREVSGIRARFEFPGLYRIGTARHSVADITKLRRLLWKPRHTLRDNVRDYIEWIRSYPVARNVLRQNLHELDKQNIVKRARFHLSS